MSQQVPKGPILFLFEEGGHGSSERCGIFHMGRFGRLVWDMKNSLISISQNN